MTLTYSPHATTLPAGRTYIPAGLDRRIAERWLREPFAMIRAKAGVYNVDYEFARYKITHLSAIGMCMTANLRWSTITRQNLDDPFMSDEHRQRRITEAVERRRRGIASQVTRKRRSTSADPS